MLKNEAMYQYPKSDNFHFYEGQSYKIGAFTDCINILNRITFISTMVYLMKDYIYGHVSIS